MALALGAPWSIIKFTLGVGIWPMLALELWRTRMVLLAGAVLAFLALGFTEEAGLLSHSAAVIAGVPLAGILVWEGLRYVRVLRRERAVEKRPRPTSPGRTTDP